MGNTEKSRQAKCKFCHRCMGPKHNESHCVVDGWDDDKVKTVTDSDCENCDKFKSKYIEYPLTINGINNKPIDNEGLFHKVGCLCEIQPCGDEYEGKSYIGIYIGELPIAIHTTFDSKTGILENGTMNNPAIFVPELGKIIYGCQSWWREIESIDDFKGITKEEIENQWYVKMLKNMIPKNEDNGGQAND